MKRQETSNVTERYALMEESVLLRIRQLQNGLVQLTDATTAERLLKQFGKDIRYIAPWKKWIVWNGANWETDSGALIHTKGLEIVRNIYAEIYKTADYREQMEIEKYAVKSESTRQRENFVRAARYILDLNAAVDDLDRDPWLLNVENGTVDLRTGELLPHRQEDMITKIAKVQYDRNAEYPKWKQFIREIMGYKGDLIAFIQTAAGWAVSGDISEQSMFILYGTGANGKSTFLNVVMHILGDYAVTTYAETFMKRSNETLTNDIARLRGTRFVATTETEQGKRLSEHLIKQATGNDQLTARFLYGEHFNFLPTFKIFMASNHKPVIKGTDHGIWRRIKLIPFTTLITEEKRDRHLEQKLLEEKPGILNWLIEGVLRWRKEGLNTPSVVLNATDEYRGEMDVIGNFMRERCVQKPGVMVRARELFRAYQEWCEENNEMATSERIFGLRMKELGMVQKRTAEARYWQDVAVQG